MIAHDEPIIITAYGTPATQGSKRHIGKGIMVEASTRTRPWRETVTDTAWSMITFTSINDVISQDADTTHATLVASVTARAQQMAQSASA